MSQIQPTPKPSPQKDSLTPPPAISKPREIKYEGRPIINGVAVAKALVIEDISADPGLSHTFINPEQIADELIVLENALVDAKSYIMASEDFSDYQKTDKCNHLMQTKRLQAIRELISNSNYSCLSAVRTVFQEQIDWIKERDLDLVPDFKQAQEYLECAITGTRSALLELLESQKEPFILCAQSLSSEAVYAALKSGNLRGIVIGDSGTCAHFRIVAEAHSIPVISLERDIKGLIRNQEVLILDTQGPVLYQNPRAETLKLYEGMGTETTFTYSQIRSPLLTSDGHSWHVFAVAGDFEKEPEEALQLGAEGLGLIRSEIAYFQTFKRDGRTPPLPPLRLEDELTEKYSRLFESYQGKEIQIRTLDFTADKNSVLVSEILAYHVPEADRHSLNRAQQIAKYFIAPQIRSILRASSQHDDAGIYFPQIGTSESFQKRLNFLEQQKGILESQGHSYNGNIRVGAMVETVEGLHRLKNIADARAKMICIGSNDLLAGITGGSRLGDALFPANPVLLKVLKDIDIPAIESKYGIKFFLCGNLAKAAYCPLAMALGFTNICSLSSEFEILSEMFPNLKMPECEQLLADCSGEESDLVIRNILGDFFKDKAEVHW